MLNSLPYELEPAISVAAGLGVDAVQIPLTAADGQDFRRDLVQAASNSGLAVSATAVNLGDWGEVETLAARIEAAKPLIDITREMGTHICQTHIGTVPYSPQGARWNSFVETAAILNEYAANQGVVIAIETGPEPPHVLEKLLQTVDSSALGINYDPANLVIWPAAFPNHPDRLAHTEIGSMPLPPLAEFEAVEGVRRLGRYIVHTHAKDAIGDGSWDDVPLGEGRIDWQLYLQYLKDINFDGYLSIERECGDDRVSDIGRAVSFLRAHLSQLEARQVAAV